MGMRLVTFPGVFRPRSDSWMLAHTVRSRVRPGATVVDPFTGSGILAIAAAQAGARATAIDISRRAVLATRINARLNGVHLEVLRADSMASLGARRFDMIVANPPYVPGEEIRPRGAARAWEAGPDGRRFIDVLCDEAPRHLNPGGRLLMVHSAFCGEDETLRRLADRGLEADVIARSLGALGPLMAERAERLVKLGYEPQMETEEMLIFEASLSPLPALTGSRVQTGPAPERLQSGYSSLRHERGSSDPGFGVRSSSMLKWG
jgi:release factor glutamine methyltransferase